MADFYVSAIMLRPFRVLGCWGAALMASMIIDLMDSISDLRSPKNGPFDQIQAGKRRGWRRRGCDDDPDGQGLHRDAANGQRGDDHDVGCRVKRGVNARSLGGFGRQAQVSY